MAYAEIIIQLASNTAACQVTEAMATLI